MYDADKTDSCTITVIATGLEVVENNAQSRIGTGVPYRQPATHITPNSLKGFNVQSAGTQSSSTAKPNLQPLPGLQKPTDIRSSVKDQTLKIPDFLQKK